MKQERNHLRRGGPSRHVQALLPRCVTPLRFSFLLNKHSSTNLLLKTLRNTDSARPPVPPTACASVAGFHNSRSRVAIQSTGRCGRRNSTLPACEHLARPKVRNAINSKPKKRETSRAEAEDNQWRCGDGPRATPLNP